VSTTSYIPLSFSKQVTVAPPAPHPLYPSTSKGCSHVQFVKVYTKSSPSSSIQSRCCLQWHCEKSSPGGMISIFWHPKISRLLYNRTSVPTASSTISITKYRYLQLRCTVPHHVLATTNSQWLHFEWDAPNPLPPLHFQSSNSTFTITLHTLPQHTC
jgi:hypothetical protein